MRIVVLFIFCCISFLSLDAAQKQMVPDILLPEGAEGKSYRFEEPYSSIDAGRYQYLSQASSNIKYKPYDVLTYKLFMDWTSIFEALDNQTELYYNASSTISIRIDSANTTSISLDAVELKINQILLNDNALISEPFITQQTLDINLTDDIQMGDTISLVVDYTYTWKKSGRGLHAYQKGKDMEAGPAPLKERVIIEENIAFTFNEPQMARFWFPCNDSPYDKALYSIDVKVPDGYAVASNGLNVDNETVEDNNIISHWVSNSPMASYLVVVHASKYVSYTEYYNKVSAPEEKVPVQYFVWSKDYEETRTDGLSHNARHAFRNMIDMMECLSSQLIEYPFEKYGMAAIQPIFFGGMEHQAMTSLNRNMLRYKSSSGYNIDHSNQGVIVHELGHQWFGDLVTCARWNDIWVNEGGAVWTEMLWEESRSPGKGYNQIYKSRRRSYMRPWNNTALELHPLYDAPQYDLFEYSITYCKASMIYNMIYNIMGQETGLKIFRDILTHFAYKSVETIDVQNFLETNYPDSPVPWSRFFDQWIFKAGHPVYELAYSMSGKDAETKVKVQLKQIQSEFPRHSKVPDLFITPVTFILKGGDQEERFTFINNKEDQMFEMSPGFYPSDISIDSLTTLNYLAYKYKSVEDNISLEASQAYPNPARDGQIFKIPLTLREPGFVSAELYNTLGNFIDKIFDQHYLEGSAVINVPTRNLVPGGYYVRVFDGRNSYTVSFTVIK